MQNEIDQGKIEETQKETVNEQRQPEVIYVVKKNHNGIWIVLILLTALFITNPTKDDFNRKICEVASKESSSYNASECSAMLSMFKSILELAYHRDDYYFFSVYEISASANNGEAMTYIGLFKNFIRIK